MFHVKQLIENRELSKYFDTTKNKIIVGDNLDALEILREEYAGRIKMIYIDPPYNTPVSVLTYNNRFGKHNDFIAFMRPRLEIAKELLTDDGGIFISIDEWEYAYLKVYCDDLFNENNFVGDIIRRTRAAMNVGMCNFDYQHEFCLIYAKQKNKFSLKGEKKYYSAYEKMTMRCKGRTAPNVTNKMSFGIKNPYTNTVDYPSMGRTWSFSKETFDKMVESGRVVFKKEVKNGQYSFFIKDNNEKTYRFILVKSLFGIDSKYLNAAGHNELCKLMGSPVFTYPKPVAFIKKLVYMTTVDGDIILDFFAGSGTTAHAVIELNKDEYTNRSYILVQLKEALKQDSYGYEFVKKHNLRPYISDLTIERVKRASNIIEDQAGLFAYAQDFGYKVLEIDEGGQSNGRGFEVLVVPQGLR
ncbi:site-specific DNA-methyltransferase [Endomicrobiia bacterium]|nr:site-specific DNA-methyltransferase [Endomicrobiia bacterium]